MKRSKKSDTGLDTHLLQAALEIQEFFEEHGWDFAFIGGLALMRWGQRRVTEDVDGTLLTLFADEENYVDMVLEKFESRISDARNFALRNRVLLLTASNGIGIDFSLGGLPFEQNAVERASFYEYAPDFVLRTCSAEDLIIYKTFADREQDRVDVRWILERQRGKLEIDYILNNLRPLAELKEAPEIVDRLEEMIRRTEQTP